MKTRILLVEDDERLADLTAEYLRKNEFEVAIEPRGDTAEERILKEDPELVVLDVMLPGKDGFEVCRAIRDKYKGVILIMTARDEDLDQILGLELGADDYICKPYSPREVVARVKAVLRRAQHASAALATTGASLIEIDGDCWQVRVAGQRLDLTPKEFQLLQALVKKPGRVFSRGQLLDSIYEDNFESFLFQ